MPHQQQVLSQLRLSRDQFSTTKSSRNDLVYGSPKESYQQQFSYTVKEVPESFEKTPLKPGPSYRKTLPPNTEPTKPQGTLSQDQFQNIQTVNVIQNIVNYNISTNSLQNRTQREKKQKVVKVIKLKKDQVKLNENAQLHTDGNTPQLTSNLQSSRFRTEVGDNNEFERDDDQNSVENEYQQFHQSGINLKKKSVPVSSSRVPIIINNQIFSREEKQTLIKKISLKDLDTDFANKDRNQLQQILKQNQQIQQKYQTQQRERESQNITQNKSNLSNLRVSNQDPVNIKSPKQRSSSGSVSKTQFRKSPFLKQLIKGRTKHQESDKDHHEIQKENEGQEQEQEEVSPQESPNAVVQAKSPISQKYYRTQQQQPNLDFKQASGAANRVIRMSQNTQEMNKSDNSEDDEYYDEEVNDREEEEKSPQQRAFERFEEETKQVQINPGRNSESEGSSFKNRSNSQAPSKKNSDLDLDENAPKPLSLKRDNSIKMERSHRVNSSSKSQQQITDDCFKMQQSPKSDEDISFSEEKQKNTKLCEPSFPIAQRQKEAFQQYISMILHSVNSKEIMMQPIPLNVGMLQFEIVREKKGLNFMKPLFKLFIEKNKDEKFVCMFAKKKFFNKGSNYIISLDQKAGNRESEQCLGKLRGDSQGDNYNLYNNGENPKLLTNRKMSVDNIRNEHFALEYKYVPCSIGRLRKTKLIMPALDNKGMPYEYKPLRESDSMMKQIQHPKERTNFFVFMDNPPKWNSKTKAYHYDFKGRVTEASVKNFQIIPYQDGLKGCNIRDFVVQFGRSGENVFKLDAQYPFSIFQAFGLALTACDFRKRLVNDQIHKLCQYQSSIRMEMLAFINYPCPVKKRYHQNYIDLSELRRVYRQVQDDVSSIKEPLMHFYPEIPPFEIFEYLMLDELNQSTYKIYSDFPILKGEKLNQRKLTIHLACLFFDKLMHMKYQQNEERKASMCVIVASKQDELDDKIPLIREIQKISQFKFHYKECQDEESSILLDLNWNLNYITPLHLVQSLLSLGVVFSNDRDLNSNKPIEEHLIARVRKFSNYFADFSMKYDQLMKYRPSKLALSCILCARRYAQIDPAWNPIFTDITGYEYNQDQIIDIQNTILSLYKEKCEKQIQEKQTKSLPSQGGRVSSVLENNQNIMNDSTIIQSQQKQEKMGLISAQEERQNSTSKGGGMCGLDDYLLDMVPVVSGQNFQRSCSKSREDFQTNNSQQVAIVRIQPLHQINSKPKNPHKRKESEEIVNKENQKSSIAPFQGASPSISTVQKQKDSQNNSKSHDNSSIRTTINTKNIPKPMLPHIPLNKVPDAIKSSNNVCINNIMTAPQSRCTSIYSNQQQIHQQAPAETLLQQRNQSESNLYQNCENTNNLKQSSVTITAQQTKLFKGSSIGNGSNNSSLTRKHRYQGMFNPNFKEAQNKNPLNIHTATKRLEQIKNKYQSEQVIKERTKTSNTNSRNQSQSFNQNKSSQGTQQLLKSKQSLQNRCPSHQSDSEEQLKHIKQFKTQQEKRKTGVVLEEEEERELERTITQGEICATDITQNFSECVEVNPNEQSFIKKPIQSNVKKLIHIDPHSQKNEMVEKAMKEIYKVQGPLINEEHIGRNKKLSNKFSINNTYRTSGDFRDQVISHNNSSNQVKFTHIKSSSGHMPQYQEKNTSIANLKQINYIQRNISQVSTSHRGEITTANSSVNMPLLQKQRMIDQCRQAFKGARSSHTANQSYLNGNTKRLSKQQNFKNNKLQKQKSLSTNKSLASISAQFQINIINAEDETLPMIEGKISKVQTNSKERESLERQIAHKNFQMLSSNMQSHKSLFDRRSHYIKSEQLEKRSFIRDANHHCLTKKSSPKNLQSSSLLMGNQNNDSKEDLKQDSKSNIKSGLKSWRKDSDIILVFEQYHSKFDNNIPSSQRNNSNQKYGTHLCNTKFNLFKNKKPKKSFIPQSHAYPQLNSNRDNSMLENAVSSKAKMSLQPISSTNLQTKNLQNSRQTVIPQMKFVSNILNASKELMSNNMILNTNTNPNQSHVTNHSTLSCTNQESKNKILSDRAKFFNYDENKARDLIHKEQAKYKKVVGTLGSKKNQLLRGNRY